MLQGAKRIIRVLVVEDSPTAATALQKILNSDRQIVVVHVARDGEEAIDRTARLKPDLITMDVNLPRIDGLEVTRKIMATQPTPILILSSSSFTDQAHKEFQAISCGALDVINKDEVLSPQGHEAAQDLIHKVKFFSGIKVIRHPFAGLSKGASPWNTGIRITADPDRLVAMVGSTGGPEAIGKIFKQFPAPFPCGIVVVVHLAHGFTEGFVEWLQSISAIMVKVGVHDEPIRPGVAYVAPTGYHMRVTEERTIHLGDDPPCTGLKPYGDYLLESVALHYGKGSIGVVLTGMGKDGATGIQRIKERGGRTVAQDEGTSAIFGMPKVAIETGAVDKVLPVEQIPLEIMRHLQRLTHDQ